MDLFTFYQEKPRNATKMSEKPVEPNGILTPQRLL
jgi:hypothetical protein